MASALTQSGIVTTTDMEQRDPRTAEETRAAQDGFTYHGGHLGAARLAFAAAPEPWIDLSTGINGEPYPVGPIDPAAWARLPEPPALEALCAAAARAYGADPADVVAAPGTQALIQLLPRLMPAARVGVLGPTYAEHARAWRDAGASVETVADPDDLGQFDVAVVVNPNNPDGRVLTPAHLLAAAPRNGLLIVDEAFADLMPEGTSLVPHRPGRGVVVLRSFGKTYGLAGVRLGFAVASPTVAATIRSGLGPWAVSGPAIEIGTRALDDHVWRREARTRLDAQAARLDACLGAAGATVIGGTPLFRLAEVDDGAGWFHHLARHGILVRPFAERPRWLRLGIPAQPWQWDRLALALESRRAG